MGDAPENAEVDPEYEAALAALHAEAHTINVAVRQVEKAAGYWHSDPHGVVARMAHHAEDRFHVEPFLACAHFDCPVFYVTAWAGEILAAVCSKPLCRAALDHVIESSRFGWCGACDWRPPGWPLTVTITPIATGRLLIPGHDSCLFPDRPIEAIPTAR